MRVNSSVRMIVALLAPWGTLGSADAKCQTGRASAPYIGGADMRRIDRASAHLPRAKGPIAESIGSPVPHAIRRARVPSPVKKVLPQYRYAGYSAFRIDGKLAIVNGQGTLSYLLPLEGARAPGNCP